MARTLREARERRRRLRRQRPGDSFGGIPGGKSGGKSRSGELSTLILQGLGAVIHRPTARNPSLSVAEVGVNHFSMAAADLSLWTLYATCVYYVDESGLRRAPGLRAAQTGLSR